jgi:hypothetical protein
MKLSPDGSGRFFMMARLLEIFHTGDKNTISLLDVGGSSSFMTSQLKESPFPYLLTAIDILPRPRGFQGTYVQGDATNMEFGDKTFNTVITTDVLEHIPISKKADFVKECIRVAKDYVVIAAPFNTEGVDVAEHATNEFNIKLFNEGQVWLEEHFENTKPELSEVLETAKKMNCETQVIGTNNLYTWLLSTHINLVGAKLGLDDQGHTKSNMLLNEHLLTSGDMTPPYYRHFVVIFKNKPTKAVREKLNILALPDIDHTPSINYFHELMDLVASRMIETRTELNKMNEKLRDGQAQIESLERMNEEKQAIIKRCAPYLKVLALSPKRIIRYGHRRITANSKVRGSHD